MLPEGNTVEVNSMPDCIHCTEAKVWLSLHGIPFKEIVHPDPAERQAFYDANGLVGGKRTMPQVFLVDEISGDRSLLGGASDLKASGLA